MAQQPQHGGLPAAGLTEHQQMLSGQVEDDGLQAVLVDAENTRGSGRGGPQVGVVDTFGQEPDRRCPPPGAGWPETVVRQRDHHRQSVGAQPVPGPVPGDAPGPGAVDLGVGRIAQPHFDTRADQIPQRGPDVGPPRGGQHHVHPMGQAGAGYRGDHLVQAVRAAVFPSGRSPSVDHQEDVTIGIVGTGSRRLATAQHREDVDDGASDQVGVRAARHGADMGQVGQITQSPAAEIEAVHLHAARIVGRGQRGHERFQDRRLPGPWRSDHREIACRAGQIDHERAAAVLEGVVHQSDRHPQVTTVMSVHQRAEAGRIGQRWQPHPMRRRTVPGQPVDHRLEQRGVQVRCPGSVARRR